MINLLLEILSSLVFGTALLTTVNYYRKFSKSLDEAQDNYIAKGWSIEPAKKQARRDMAVNPLFSFFYFRICSISTLGVALQILIAVRGG